MIKNLFSAKFILSLGLVTLLFACGNNKSADNEAKTDSTSATAMDEKSQPPAMPALPFNAMVIRHIVADYDKWRPFFDADSVNRNAAGMHLIGVARGIENQNEIDIPFMIDDVAKTKAFSTDPKLKEVMSKAGVISPPDIKFIQVMRMSEEITKKGDFVEISHKVKDFDAWLKAFDSEGPETRSKDGLTDGVLARGIDDPSLVYLVFRITDLSQAKAALLNPARLKVMMEAGVIGKPDVYFGRDQK